jgi:hypothetical protein
MFDFEAERMAMTFEKKKIYDLIRAQVQVAIEEESRIASFNLSGRGHEPRVTLNRRLAAVLRGQNIPSVYISGFGANSHYPLRVFLKAAQSIKKIRPDLPLTICSGVACLSELTVAPR